MAVKLRIWAETRRTDSRCEEIIDLTDIEMDGLNSPEEQEDYYESLMKEILPDICEFGYEIIDADDDACEGIVI